MDPQTEQLASRAGHIALSMALTKQYRKAGPMEHATGRDCSRVPLHRLRDLTRSLQDLPEDRPLNPLPTFDGFPATAGNPADRAKLTGELTRANLAGRDAAAAERV